MDSDERGMWNSFRVIYPLDDSDPAFYEGLLCPTHEGKFRILLDLTKCKKGELSSAGV